MKKCIEWGKKFLQITFCASLIFALTGLTACSDDDDDGGSSGPTPKLTTPLLQLEDNGKITITNYAAITAETGFNNEVNGEMKTGHFVVMVGGSALTPQPLISLISNKQQFTIEQKKVDQVVTVKATVAEGVTWVLDSDPSEAVTVVGINIDDKPSAPDTPETNGKIIKNQVLDFSNSTTVYTEYLTFTSATGGTYELYKKDANDTEAAKITDASVTIGTKTFTIPSTFIYNESTFVVTAGGATSYLFQSGSDYYCASVKLTPAVSAKKGIYDKWQESADLAYQLNNYGTLTIWSKDEGNNAAISNIAGYEKTGPFISNTGAKLAFLWMQVAQSSDLYAYASKASIATEAGKGSSVVAKSNLLEFQSNKFLLLK